MGLHVNHVTVSVTINVSVNVTVNGTVIVTVNVSITITITVNIKFNVNVSQSALSARGVKRDIENTPAVSWPDDPVSAQDLDLLDLLPKNVPARIVSWPDHPV